MCDSQGSSDPTTYDLPKRPACQRRIWMHGRERDCGMEFGVVVWTDATGSEHVACRHHRMELQHRYPPVETLATA